MGDLLFYSEAVQYRTVGHYCLQNVPACPQRNGEGAMILSTLELTIPER